MTLSQSSWTRMMQEQNDKTVVTSVTNEAIGANPMLMGLQEADFGKSIERQQGGFFSVTNAITAFRNCQESESRKIYARLKDDIDKLGIQQSFKRIAFARANGRKGNLVDCLPFDKLLPVLALVPGERAKQLRSEQANLAARAVVGDEQLEAAMPIRREQLSEKTRHDVLGSIEQPANKKRRIEPSSELELIEQKIEMIGARKRLCIAEFTEPLDTYKCVLEALGVKLDDRDKIFFEDEARNSARQALEAMKSVNTPLAITAPSTAVVPQPVAVPPPVVARQEFTMTDIFLQLAPSPKPTGAERSEILKSAGKLAAASYRARYGKEPPKTRKLVNGAATSVNLYFEQDRDLVEAACKKVLAQRNRVNNRGILQYYKR